MKIKNVIGIIILAISIMPALHGIFDEYEPSARARAMGGTYTALSDDADGIFYNPAGLMLGSNQVKAGYTKVFGNDFQVLTVVDASWDLPKSYGRIAFGYTGMDVDYQDVNMMSEKTFMLGHSFTLMKDVHSQLHVGYTANAYHISMDGFSNRTTYGINLGATAVLHTRTRLAFAITNINNPRVGKDDDYELPQEMTIGIAYVPYTGVITTLDVKKTFNAPSDTGESTTEIHAGVEATLFEIISLRMGVQDDPTMYSAGVGINVHGAMVEYAYQVHSVLDDTHHFGIGFNF